MPLGFLAGIVGLARDFDPTKIPSNDFIHYKPPQSVYRRTDYLVNSDMSIPLALASTWRYGVAWELMARQGLPQVDRAPGDSPIVLAPGTIHGRGGR